QRPCGADVAVEEEAHIGFVRLIRQPVPCVAHGRYSGRYTGWHSTAGPSRCPDGPNDGGPTSGCHGSGRQRPGMSGSASTIAGSSASATATPAPAARAMEWSWLSCSSVNLVKSHRGTTETVVS